MDKNLGETTKKPSFLPFPERGFLVERLQIMGRRPMSARATRASSSPGIATHPSEVMIVTVCFILYSWLVAKKKKTRTIGVMGAMPPEIAMLKKHVNDVEEIVVNPTLTIYKGTLHGNQVVFASAGVGTVFAATTATSMVTLFNIDALVFTGVAGGLQKEQKVGDIVIGKDCVNYDMDVTKFVPFPDCKFERGQIPFVPDHWKREYAADPRCSHSPVPLHCRKPLRALGAKGAS